MVNFYCSNISITHKKSEGTTRTNIFFYLWILHFLWNPNMEQRVWQKLRTLAKTTNIVLIDKPGDLVIDLVQELGIHRNIENYC